MHQPLLPVEGGGDTEVNALCQTAAEATGWASPGQTICLKFYPVLLHKTEHKETKQWWPYLDVQYINVRRIISKFHGVQKYFYVITVLWSSSLYLQVWVLFSNTIPPKSIMISILLITHSNSRYTFNLTKEGRSIMWQVAAWITSLELKGHLPCLLSIMFAFLYWNSARVSKKCTEDPKLDLILFCEMPNARLQIST